MTQHATRNTAWASRIPSSTFYLLSLCCLALGLMSKPMLVTWPFVMLLLDYWPLRRFGFSMLRSSAAKDGSALNSQLSTTIRLVTEKIPFFALAVVTSIATLVVQKQGGILATVDKLPLGVRGGNALISYCRYLGKLFWPTDLAVIYPHPGYWPLEKVLLADVMMVGISAVLLVRWRRYPFLLMGWLWYCGTLLPVIQLVQTGTHAMADRYTYIPSLGLLIFAIWGAYELSRRWRYGVITLSVAASAAIILCIGLTRQQIGHWQDSETLFRHALQVTENNYLAHKMLGDALVSKGQVDEAFGQYQEALRLKPNSANSHNGLGIAFGMKGQLDEAITQFQEALRLKPDFAEAEHNLAIALDKKGPIDEAIRQYQETIRVNPNDADAHNKLGDALLKSGRIDEAIRQYQEALRLKPAQAGVHNNLGIALGMKGQVDEAITQFQEAIRLKPDFAEAHNNLARALGTRNAPASR